MEARQQIQVKVGRVNQVEIPQNDFFSLSKVWSGEETFWRVILVWGIGLWHVIVGIVSFCVVFATKHNYTDDEIVFATMLTLPVCQCILLGRWLYRRVRGRHVLLRILIMIVYTVIFLPLLTLSVLILGYVGIYRQWRWGSDHLSYFELFNTLYGGMF